MAALKASQAVVSLTITQRLVLATAAGRDDGALEMPARLRGQAAQNFLGALTEKGLAREIRAKPDMPVCRHDGETGRSYAVVITRRGRTSIPAPVTQTTSPEAEPEPRALERSSTAPSGKAPHVGAVASAMPDARLAGKGAEASMPAFESSAGVAAAAASTAPRQGSKLAEVMALLARDTGASVEDLMAATGWLPHTTRAALTGLRKRGFTILREQRDGKGSVYRIEPVSTAKAA